MSVVTQLNFILLVTLRIAWILFQHFIEFPALIGWFLVAQPVRLFSEVLYWQIDAFLYNVVLTGIGGWAWTAQHKVIEYGEDIYSLSESRAIMICNHQSMADVPLLFNVLHNKGRVFAQMMWIMDRILKYTHFGFTAKLHGDYFIQQFSKSRDQELEWLGNHIRDVYYPLNRKWVAIFPEGGFLYKRRERSQRYAKKNDLPILEHVSLPRVGALQVLMENMTPPKCQINAPEGENRSVKYLIDLTLGYPDQSVLSLFGVILGTQGPRTIHAYYRYFSVENIPRDTQALTAWLYDRFVEKEFLLSELYRTGSYPDLSDQNSNNFIINQPREIHNHVSKYIYVHTFLTTSAYFFYLGFARIYATLFT